jgi:alcohol dehydrogenase (cytochrome c)
VKWEYPLYRDTWGGLLSTAGNLVFSGTLEGQVFALDSVTGEELWHVNTGGRVNAAPITYLFEGKQLITMAAGNAVFTFGLE